MSIVDVPSQRIGELGRAAHDLGLGALLGGTLFGRMALHPAVANISDARVRGEVVNAAWRRYGTVNSIALAAVALGWAGARAAEAADRNLTAHERRLARAKDALVATLVVSGLASAAEGVRFGRAAPHGAVPLADGSHPSPETPERAAAMKRRLNALGAVTLAAEFGLVAVDAAMAEAGFRGPSRRRRSLRGRLSR